MKRHFSCLFLLILGLIGCGTTSEDSTSSATRGASGIDVSTTVTLPSSSALSISSLTTKNATTET
ncbi:MAG: hypothetical protein HYT77_02210, partial [Deltaproteobacteria bacterium]|nr:hypothetical protein [Deltaproteobacteria bacterium]